MRNLPAAIAHLADETAQSKRITQLPQILGVFRRNDYRLTVSAQTAVCGHQADEIPEERLWTLKRFRFRPSTSDRRSSARHAQPPVRRSTFHRLRRRSESPRTNVRAKARIGIEPMYRGFADLRLTTWLPRRIIEWVCGCDEDTQAVRHHVDMRRELKIRRWIENRLAPRLAGC